MEEKKEYAIHVLGETTGKSSIGLRYFQNRFEGYLDPGWEHPTPSQIVVDGKSIPFTVEIHPAQEEYTALIRDAVQVADGILLVYAIDDRRTWEAIGTWLSLVKKDAPKLLVGNKSDLDHERKVSKEEASKYAQEQGMAFIEVSAKTGDNIKEAVSMIALLIDQKKDSSNEPSSPSKRCTLM
eukprot:TRINITY_DN5824_c0_g1_i1.p1 TRINITY_DN5824_c0_g1~~TRINITY_DN5824_c0_g1_i1.p1  ORF type:complete len:182 (-),score=34.56 TRINITY_DN5824_c0_g1_i1:32-577(-)